MNMTREDILRELELLPVWRSRASALPPVELAQEIADLKLAEITEKPPTAAEPVAETSFYIVVSDDKKWAFVLPEALTGAAQTLFDNILLALQINKTHAESLANLDVKVTLVLGEIAAQQLLNSTESLEQLRGKTHVFKNSPLVATYHPNDLLQHLANKAKMWDDLCIAKPLAST